MFVLGIVVLLYFFFFFFFNDTATTEIYTLSLHDALPISLRGMEVSSTNAPTPLSSQMWLRSVESPSLTSRSEEHTSELQSPCNLVCRLLLEKKKQNHDTIPLARCGCIPSDSALHLTHETV